MRFLPGEIMRYLSGQRCLAAVYNPLNAFSHLIIYVMKLSVLLICSFLSVMLPFSPLTAKTIVPHTANENACLPPGLPVITDITSVSALLSWTASADVELVTYQWKIVLEGLPPQSASVFNGFSTDTFALVVGLAAATTYDVYVRSDCDSPGPAEWIGPVTFTTSPGCGDVFYDSGGPLANYQDGEKTVVTICPDLPTQVVTLTFEQFNLAEGDTMQIFDGASLDGLLIGTYTQTTLPGFKAFATTPSGCLTVQFTSDLFKVETGWAAVISCNPPLFCFPVQEINVFNLQTTSANFSWPAVFGAIAYQWEVRTLSNALLYTGITAGTSLNVPGLTEATNYVFRVRTFCNTTGDSDWTTINFFTPINCSNKPFIQCGSASGPISASGLGIWETRACGNTTPTPGQERIFRFIAPQTRMYTFQTIGGSSTENSYVTYAYKESGTGCGPFDWECIGSFLVTLNGVSTTFGPLTAGKEYLILFDPETTAFVQHSFRIRDCEPVNDEAPGAVALVVGSPCVGNIYSNKDATFNNVDSLGIEPNPDVDIDVNDELSGRWLTSADETVWFKFKASESGSVIISTESIPQGSNFDTQLALYEVKDSSQYKFFNLIVSDDDNGDGGLGYNSVFSYSGLTPDSTYYIQVDGYGAISGNFCIEVRDGVIRLDDEECTPGYFVENVDGTVEGGDRWYNIYSRPDILDLGDLLVAVKPGPQNLDTVFCRMSVADTIPYSINEVPYLPAYVSLSTSELPVEPYSVRMFFNNSEFDSLVVKSGFDPLTTTIDQLVATHYTGPNEDCFQLNNDYESGGGTGIPTLITDLKAVEMGPSMFYVEFQIWTQGEVGIHLIQRALPVELKSFTGKIVGGVNRLEWTTQTEKNVAWHIVERSGDGLNWQELGRQAGQANALSPTSYNFDDIRPLQKSYYRLRSLDFDGESSVSSIVVLTRRADGLAIDRVFPSPTQDRLTIEFSTSVETDAIIRVSDITGQTVLEEQVTGVKGSHNTTLSLQSLPAGVYIVSLSDGVSVVAPVRVVKQ